MDEGTQACMVFQLAQGQIVPAKNTCARGALFSIALRYFPSVRWGYR